MNNFSKIIVTIILIIISQSLHAKKYEGIVILKSNDTINCKIIHNDLHVNNWKEHVLSKKFIKIEYNGEQSKLRPNEIISYSIKFKDQWKTYWGISTEKEHFFMEKIIEGNATLYRCMTYGTFNYQYYSHYYIFRNDNKNTLYIRNGTFGIKRKLLNYFKDCDEIKDGIANKLIKPGRNDHDEIAVNLFNDKC